MSVLSGKINAFRVKLNEMLDLRLFVCSRLTRQKEDEDMERKTAKRLL